MANRSKKHLILQASLPLFLARGYKGTSVDSVVKASCVSKPTVYNHFPDKSDLFREVIYEFVSIHQPNIDLGMDASEIEQQIHQHCLNDLSVRMLGIVLAEGFRFKQTRQYFMENYIQAWCQAIAKWTDKKSLSGSDKVSQLKVRWFDALSVEKQEKAILEVES